MGNKAEEETVEGENSNNKKPGFREVKCRKKENAERSPVGGLHFGRANGSPERQRLVPVPQLISR